MADKKQGVTDKVREAVNSPTGRRVVSGLEDATAAGVEGRVIDRAKKAWANRKKQKRSSSR